MWLPCSPGVRSAPAGARAGLVVPVVTRLNALQAQGGTARPPAAIARPTLFSSSRGQSNLSSVLMPPYRRQLLHRRRTGWPQPCWRLRSFAQEAMRAIPLTAIANEATPAAASTTKFHMSTPSSSPVAGECARSTRRASGGRGSDLQRGDVSAGVGLLNLWLHVVCHRSTRGQHGVGQEGDLEGDDSGLHGLQLGLDQQS